MTASAHPEAPATSDDLAAEILRRRRKQLPRVTVALALVVALSAGVLGGIEIEKHWGGSGSGSGSGSTSATSARSGFASRFALGSGARSGRGLGGAGGFGGFGAAGTGTTGTVTLIKGSTLYVTEASGNTVIVRTSPSSRVTKTVSGSVETIHPGDAVAVTGPQSANGSYTASSIAITSAGNG
jgi:hypothetical protein